MGVNVAQGQYPIWHNGRLVPWENCQVHVLAHALHYGSSVFEGIRAYKTPTGPQFFRLDAHLRRLSDSARIYRMPIPYDRAALAQACADVVRASQLDAAYLRPLVYRGLGPLGLVPKDHPVDVAIAAMQWGRYLGEAAFNQGVHICVSSWARLAPNTIPTHAKAGGNYLSSQLIALEARQHGFDEAVALDTQGYVSEGPGENIFLVKDGVLYTPPSSAALLPGITRSSILKLAQTLQIPAVEATISREALYLADEMFFTGTAAELTPITRIEGLQVGSGSRGPMTEKLQAAFFGLFDGTQPDTYGWLSPV
ncbi:MAG: branched-chain amino acid transaminase [Deltaproteobacteria bacterium]|nr:MAG: branched-chain amino acid transaminase [Deltaproteobacteria bacterium]